MTSASHLQISRMYSDNSGAYRRANYSYCPSGTEKTRALQYTQLPASTWPALGLIGHYIYSFNGPHSLFVDTVRTLRSLALGHLLGQLLRDELGREISLLHRLVQHALATARYNVYYGEGRDIYDVRGRVAHETLFNTEDGSFRAPNTQQGYSPFSTWARGPIVGSPIPR